MSKTIHKLIKAVIISTNAFLAASIAMAERREPDRVFNGHHAPVAGIAGIDAATSSRPSALSVDTSGKVILWDTATSDIAWEAQLGPTSASGMVWVAPSTDGKSAVILRNHSPANIYNLQSGAVIQTLRVPDTATDERWISGAFSSDSRRVVVMSMDRDIRLFDVETGLQTAAIEKPHAGEDERGGLVGFSKDGLFVTAFTNEAISIYDATTLVVVKSLPIASLGQLFYARFSHDMRLIALATETDIFLINTETLETMFKIKKPTEGYPHGLWTATMEFDAQSLNLRVLHISMDGPFIGQYEIINTLSGITTLTERINGEMFWPDDGTNEWFFATWLMPSSNILITGRGQSDRDSLAIWKLPTP